MRSLSRWFKSRKRTLSQRKHQRRPLLLESLEPRRVLATVGVIGIWIDDTDDSNLDYETEGHIIEGRDSPAKLFFTKELTNPAQDYVAVIRYTVGFLQSDDDGHGGEAEDGDTSLPRDEYEITLGIGEFYKEAKSNGT